MEIDVTSVLRDYVAHNSGPDPSDPTRPQRPNYGIAAKLSNDVLHVALTFHRDLAYCCRETGCHLPLFDGKRWVELRRRLAIVGIAVPVRMELRLTVIIEEGAVFFDFSRPDPTRRGWYAFAPVAAHRYERTVVEGSAP